MQKLKKIILLGIPLYFLLPLSVFAVTPEEVSAAGKPYRKRYNDIRKMLIDRTINKLIKAEITGRDDQYTSFL